MPSTKPNALAWLLVSLIIIVLDQWSKAWVLGTLPEYTAVPVIDGFWNWYRTYNTGAAFSMGTALTPLFTLIAVVVVGWIVVQAARIATRGWAAAVGLIGGGAAGNLVDRILRPPGVARGAVVDFIDVAWFASFNIADTALTCGVALAVLLAWRDVPLLRRTGPRDGEQ
ncbi:MAG: signal peptidase II [Pseudonocardia sp.]|nr:signal peptidase II [Pseudonocardia sp.]